MDARETQETRFPEKHERLWLVAVSPVIWSTHFILCYVSAAIWCGRFASGDRSLWPVRVAIFAYTIVALAAVLAIAYAGYRRHRLGSAALPHDDDSPIDRHRFIGYTTFLLSGVSAIGIVYAGLPVIFIHGCD